MPVSRLLDEMPAPEVTEWEAYSLLEPFGEDAAFLRMGIICSVLASIYGKKGGKRLYPKDFIPNFAAKVLESLNIEGEVKVQSPQELKETLKTIHKAFGGGGRRKKKRKK